MKVRDWTNQLRGPICLLRVRKFNVSRDNMMVLEMHAFAVEPRMRIILFSSSSIVVTFPFSEYILTHKAEYQPLKVKMLQDMLQV